MKSNIYFEIPSNKNDHTSHVVGCDFEDNDFPYGKFTVAFKVPTTEKEYKKQFNKFKRLYPDLHIRWQKLYDHFKNILQNS